MNQISTEQQAFRNIADIEAYERVPLADHCLPETTYEALKRGTAIDPNAPAISYFVAAKDFTRPHVITHRELMAKVHQTANALHRLGIGRGDVVAYILPNLPDTHFVLWGGSAAGRTLAINPLLEASQIADLLHAAKTKIVVTLEKTPGSDIWQKTAEAVKAVPSIQHVLTCSVFGYMPAGLLAGGLRGYSKLRSAFSSSIPGANGQIPVARLDQLIATENAIALDFPAPGPGDISTMLCTGGTTGLPKIAQRSHRSEVYDAWAILQFNPSSGISGASVFCGLPLFHSNAILVTGLLPFMNGNHVVLATPQGYRGDGVIANFWKMVDHYKFVTFSGVPTVYAALLNVPRDGLDISSIRFAACGAAPMPVELFNTFIEETGIPIVEGYGLTEGAVASSINPTEPDRRRIGSIGLRLPYQKMRCAILDDTDSFARWADIDEVGAILIAGPNLFEGYIVEEQNKGIFHMIGGERWLNTGDLARQDADGYFWMTGRRKELIIRGGHNIDPKIIEESMHGHRQIAMAAAVGRPDAKAGEVPVVYYSSESGRDIDEVELRTFAEAHIAERAAIPKAFIRLDDLPVTAIGKIHKVSLNMLEIEHVIREVATSTGAEIDSLEIRQDSKRGIVAHLKTRAGKDQLQKALGQYVFHVDFE